MTFKELLFFCLFIQRLEKQKVHLFFVSMLPLLFFTLNIVCPRVEARTLPASIFAAQCLKFPTVISHLPNQEIGSGLKLTALEVESNCLFYDRDVFVQEGTSVAIFTSVQIKRLQRKSHF